MTARQGTTSAIAGLAGRETGEPYLPDGGGDSTFSAHLPLPIRAALSFAIARADSASNRSAGRSAAATWRTAD